MTRLVLALLCIACTVVRAAPVSVYFAPTSTGTECNLTVATSTNSTIRSACQIIWKGLDPLAVLQTELNIIDEITVARLNDTSYTGNNSDPNNKYRVRYSVYNLLLSAAYPKLIAAFNAGVYVQVLIESSQVDPCRSYNTALAALLAGGLRVPCFTFNTSIPICGNPNCTYNSTTCTVNSACVPAPNAQGYGTIPTQLTVEDPTQWNLLPIMSINAYSYRDPNPSGFNGWNDVGLMHTKMRLFDWTDSTGTNRSVLISGSLNPDSSSPFNDETLFISEDTDLITQYRRVYQAVLTLGRPDEATFVNPPYNASKEYNLVFSKGGILGGPQLSQTINQLISQETEMVLIFVYTLRDFGGLTAALTQAAKNGAFIMVMTDLDEVVGEPGFAAPDDKCSTMCFSAIPLSPSVFGPNVNVPVYGCKNANGLFSAFHHKNMVIGVSNMRVLTDTTNWSGSGAGTNYGSASPNCCANAEPLFEKPERPVGTYLPPQTNAQSSVGNCETALWINEGANNTIALQFVDTYFYLMNKYFTYTMTSVGQITNPDGYVIFPNSTFVNDTTTVLTGVETPIEDVFPNVQTPKAIAKLMLRMPSLKKNPVLTKLITKYA